MGGQLILDAFERELDVTAGGITPDHEWSLDRVGCIGCCTKAPVVVINDVIHARMTPFKVEEVLAGLGLERRRGLDSEEAGEGRSL
jgi:NADH-quinone oxidoreductase subunit E